MYYNPKNMACQAQLLMNGNAHQDLETPAIETVKVSVLFGRPSEHCQGFGICRVEARTMKIVCSCSKSLQANLNIGAGILCFQFNLSAFSEEVYKQHFGNGYFIVEEDFQLSLRSCRAIGIDRFIIHKGKYPVCTSGKKLSVNFH